MKPVELEDEVHAELMAMKYELHHAKASDTVRYLLLEVKGELYGSKNPDASRS